MIKVEIKIFITALFSFLFTFNMFSDIQKTKTDYKTSLTGAGSSFIFPIMSYWTSAYKEKTGIKVNYQSTGSAAGINMFQSGAADFTATEIPVTSDQLRNGKWNVFPVTASGVVPVVNIPGIENNQLTLNGDILADIFMGKIKTWDDPAIHKLNPKINLPSKKIIIIHRIGMSGTTYIFTNYLSDVSVAWKQSIGSNSEVTWPAGSIGGRENAGAAAYIKQIPYSIGYVDFNYIKDSKISCVKMINKSGNTVEANLDTFLDAVNSHPWSNAELILNESGKDSWPIIAVTYILERKDNSGEPIQDFFKFVISSKDMLDKAHDMGYIVNDKIQYLK